jgi:hypothetical protein
MRRDGRPGRGAEFGRSRCHACIRGARPGPNPERGAYPSAVGQGLRRPGPADNDRRGPAVATRTPSASRLGPGDQTAGRGAPRQAHQLRPPPGLADPRSPARPNFSGVGAREIAAAPLQVGADPCSSTTAIGNVLQWLIYAGLVSTNSVPHGRYSSESGVVLGGGVSALTSSRPPWR